MCDEVICLNVGGYIGTSTKREIEYAKELNKPIRFIEQHPDGESFQFCEHMAYSDDKIAGRYIALLSGLTRKY